MQSLQKYTTHLKVDFLSLENHYKNLVTTYTPTKALTIIQTLEKD